MLVGTVSSKRLTDKSSIRTMSFTFQVASQTHNARNPLRMLTDVTTLDTGNSHNFGTNLKTAF